MEFKKIKVTAIKFEIINGKKMGKAFSFKADMKIYGKCKTLDAVKKQVQKDVVTGKIFKKADLPLLKYDMKELQEEWKRVRPLVEAEEIKEAEAGNL